MSIETFHRKNWCLLCKLCLTCPRNLRNHFHENTCKCPEVNLKSYTPFPDKSNANEPRLSYRLRRFTAKTRAILNTILYVFCLKGNPIPDSIVRGNLCSTCQQRLRRAQIQKNSPTYKYTTKSPPTSIDSSQPCIDNISSPELAALLNENLNTLLKARRVDILNHNGETILSDTFDISLTIFEICRLYFSWKPSIHTLLEINGHIVGKNTKLEDVIPSYKHDCKITIFKHTPTHVLQTVAWN
ncbi:hypothetical protein BB560_005445 [Smittium megazygosporum]|uniref:Uncharacterized protein n=1 Tax=Smittium megazygosporum TaxID=133381 RepID=A0A2T9Z5C6_9FUNG|nr:hypothetical protein BB560_005445 [Smittium megazygosporum]